LEGEAVEGFGQERMDEGGVGLEVGSCFLARTVLPQWEDQAEMGGRRS